LIGHDKHLIARRCKKASFSIVSQGKYQYFKSLIEC
jgi:hypothetical protein